MSRHAVPLIDLYGSTCSQGPDLYADHVHFHRHIQARQAAFIGGWLCARHGAAAPRHRAQGS